jgi:hypothetical protein
MSWTQADTQIPDYYNPQSLNRYSYTLNNPLKYTDPTGHQATVDLTLPFLVVITAFVTATGMGFIGILATQTVNKQTNVNPNENTYSSVSTTTTTGDGKNKKQDDKWKEKIDNAKKDWKKLPQDKTKLSWDQAKKLMEDYLGSNYKQVGPNRYQSLDGTRLVRLETGEYAHPFIKGGEPVEHINFDVYGTELTKHIILM